MRCPELDEGQSFPVWATPLRRACLAVIANVNQSATRLDLLTGELFNPQVEEQIDYWKADDRDARSYQEKLERRKLHHYISTRQLHKLAKRVKKHPD